MPNVSNVILILQLKLELERKMHESKSPGFAKRVGIPQDASDYEVLEPKVKLIEKKTCLQPEPQQAERPLPIQFELNGLPISIENQAGTVRSGIDSGGHEWAVQLQDHYGEIRGSKGADGDYVDCFINPDYDNFNDDLIFVINQINPHTGEFDEVKVMIGYDDEYEAEQAYLRNYEDGWQGLGSMVEYDYPEFERWLKDDN